MSNSLLSFETESYPQNRRWQGPEKRWGAGERADTTEARERLMSAARFCYERLGIVSTSMADIAAQAKVTRPTVYRYFKSRQDVLHAVLRLELDQFWARLENELREVGTFGEYLVEALHYLLSNAHQDQRAKLIFSDQAYCHLRDLLLADCAIPGAARHPVYTFALQPGAKIPDDLSAAIEWFNRLALSFLSSPPQGSPESLHDLLTTLCPWKQPAIARGSSC